MKGLHFYTVLLMLAGIVGLTQATLILPPDNPDYTYSGHLRQTRGWEQTGDGSYSQNTQQLFIKNPPRDDWFKYVWLYARYANVVGTVYVTPFIEPISGYIITMVAEQMEYSSTAPYLEVTTLWKIWPQSRSEIINLSQMLANGA